MTYPPVHMYSFIVNDNTIEFFHWRIFMQKRKRQIDDGREKCTNLARKNLQDERLVATGQVLRYIFSPRRGRQKPRITHFHHGSPQKWPGGKYESSLVAATAMVDSSSSSSLILNPRTPSATPPADSFWLRLRLADSFKLFHFSRNRAI